jgi:hypothetical protein
MKIIKRIGIALLVYVAIIFAFESMIGFFQPEAGQTLVITTTDDGGNSNDRVLARLESDGLIYVAVNHWPRAWYKRALSNPNVQAAFEGGTGDYLAVPIEPNGEEHARVYRDNDPGIAFRILTGFPPRYFLRLDRRAGEGADPG